MTEKDFVFAWLLASRANSNLLWTNELALTHINKAKQIYQLIEQETKHATNS